MPRCVHSPPLRADGQLGDVQVYPDKGTVAFGSGLHGWAFNLRQFAGRYAKKFGVNKEQLMARLWGDNYFNPKTKKWTNKATDADGKALERAFNLFVLDPIFKIFDATMNNKKEKVFDMLGASKPRSDGADAIREAPGRAPQRREGPRGQGPAQGLHAQVPAGRRLAPGPSRAAPTPLTIAANDLYLAPVAQDGPALPCRDPVRGPHGRRERHRHPRLRPEGAPPHQDCS